MICSQCKKNQATVFIRTNINGQETEANLCDSCSRKYDEAEEGPLKLLSDILNNPTAFSMGLKPVVELLGLLSKSSSLPRTKIKVSACPTCGFNLRMLQTDGKLGCPSCYDHFRAELRPLLKKIQGHSIHKGIVGKRSRSKIIFKETKTPDDQDLKSQLEEAVRQENYELAAKIRDRMRAQASENKDKL